MGIFGKLFEKKECNLCGGEIGLLGNRKLEDGNMCKNCAKQLSPWFSDRRQSTVEEIEQQIAYREENKKAVAAFNTTKTLGADGNYKILMDEDAGKFMVAKSRKLEEENPDVMDFSQVTGCHLDIDEDEREITRRNADGEEESYFPRRMEYLYDFHINLHVNHPYFDEIKFEINDSRIREEGRSRTEYNRYKKVGEDICDALNNVQKSVRENVVAASAPKTAIECPSCGATTTPDASGRCEFCGGATS